jgi:hypothetical protein
MERDRGIPKDGPRDVGCDSDFPERYRGNLGRDWRRGFRSKWVIRHHSGTPKQYHEQPVHQRDDGADSHDLVGPPEHDSDWGLQGG